MIPRGEDGTFRVMVDGREELCFRNLDDISFDWGLGTDEENFVGAATAQTFEFNGPVKVTVNIKPDSPGFDRLIELRRLRAEPQETRSEVKFDLTSAVNFGDAGRARWRFPDLKLGDGKTAVPGRTGKFTSGLMMICDNPSKMA